MLSISRFYNGCIFTLLLFFLLYSQIAFSQYVSPLESDGGVDTNVYKTDTVMFEATALEDGNGNIESKTFSAGLSMLHSPYLSIFYIPIKYGLSENFQISFSLPFLTKTLVYNDTHYIKSGYGDTMLGFTGVFHPLGFLTSSTTARITLPTGNVNAQDFGYYVPMGYGGYTSSFQECVSIGRINMGIFAIRLFISGIGIYYFESTMQLDATEKDTFDKTYAWAVMGGAEFGLTKNLDVQIKGNYLNMKERRYKSSTAPTQWVDADDEVKQINILPFIKYRFPDNIAGQFGIIYPLKSMQDDSITKTYDAKWKMVFSIEKRFGEEKQLSRSEIEKSTKSKPVEFVDILIPAENKKILASENDGKKTQSKKSSKKKKRRY